MNSLWNQAEADKCRDDLELRVYTSRLLGSNPELVLHGGGNTSVKIPETNLVGEEENILYVKGSGWDLATIEAPGFTPIRMQHLLKLAKLECLTDTQMVNELKTQQTIASAPTGSVEAILHAVLPYKYVDHTHANAVVTITNLPDGEQAIRDIYGDEVVIIPYVMPGFDLARVVAERYAAEASAKTRGLVLMNHGIFSFADAAKESYETMIELVDRAEHFLKSRNAWDIVLTEKESSPLDIEQVTELRQQISQAAGKPMLLTIDRSPEALSFCQRNDLERISQQGPATPDHVIRTKRLPMLGMDVGSYVESYATYFHENAPNASQEVSMLDPAPRVILSHELGLITAGGSIKEADINADIYRHTMRIIQRAELAGGWNALPADKIFQVEYWELEQAKLRKGGSALELQGEVAMVTGAASGIGRACVDSLMARGAAVIGIDQDKSIETLLEQQAFLGIQCDVTDFNAVQAALQSGVERFGGLDMLILNAGIFPGGAKIAELDDGLWRKVMAVNLDANMSLMRDCYPLLRLSPNHGRVVVIGSKNVPAPGPGAAAYSASKAALNQLARVAALEWGVDGVRINTLHPDAVFDTGVWSEDVLLNRADHYGMTVQEYKTKNLLKTEISSSDVAELAAAMCGPLFAKTTAAQIPVDGGNDRVV